MPVPLSLERHGDKSINLKRRFGFAANTNMVPVNMQEFSRVAISYPIVFTESAPASAIAILGLRQGQNLFVDDAGAWDGGVYVPAYVRRNINTTVPGTGIINKQILSLPQPQDRNGARRRRLRKDNRVGNRHTGKFLHVYRHHVGVCGEPETAFKID